MINLEDYGVESVGVKGAIINALEAGLGFERNSWGIIPKSLKVPGRHIGLLFPPCNKPPIQSNDDFIASFEDYVEHEGLFYEIQYSVI